MDSRIKKLFRAKKSRRSALAKLPWKEKVRILIRLQEMAQPLAKKDLLHRPWKVAI